MSIGNIFVTGSSRDDYATIAYSPACVALWTNRYDGPANFDDRASALAVDQKSGNIFVTGSSGTIAYSPAGAALWTNRYYGPISGSDKAVAVDGNGTVFVTGSSYGSSGNSDYVTIAYSGAGMPLWTNRYNGPNDLNDYAVAIAVDGIGTVFVTGTSGDSPFSDFATIAYSATGSPLWTNRYNGPGSQGQSQDSASDMAVDHQGNVFVVGFSSGAYATLAYSRTGVPLWTNRYQGPNTTDLAKAVAVDRHGNVFVTGYSHNSDAMFTLFLTLGYSGAGVPLWTNWHYSGSGWHAADVAVDGTGNVFVTGVSGDARYTTLAYSGAGVRLWTNRYDGPVNRFDASSAVAVDGNGTVFVTGTSRLAGGNDDYATIAYSASGVPLWTNRYNGPANGRDQLGLRSPIAVCPDGAITYDYATIKYVWRPHLSIQPLNTGSSTVNLNLSAPPNSSWAIQRATMITGSWTNLGLSLSGTNGSGNFQDANPPARRAFYRVAQP